MRKCRHTARVLSREDAINVIQQAEFATLCMMDSDENRAYGTPISPVVIEDAIYFHSGMQGTKLDFLKQDDRVCLVAVNNVQRMEMKLTTGYESAIVYGRFSYVDDYEERRFIMREFCKKFAPHNAAESDAAMDRTQARTNVCKITIEEISGKKKPFMPEGAYREKGDQL